jgi:gas vesicle structural protein
MAVERAAGGTSLIDVLDRVLDKGIVIDAWVRVSLVGIDLITVEARVVVASIDTYLKYSEAVGQVAPVSRPAAELPSHQDVVAENVALRAELAATKKGARADLAAAAKGARADIAAAKKGGRAVRRRSKTEG